MARISLMNSRKKAQALYSALQILYWINNGFLFAFASVYLQTYSFTTSQIGLVLGVAYILSSLLQPAVVSVLEHFGVRLNTGLSALYVLIALLAACMLVLPLPNGVLAVIMVAALALQSSAQPHINSLAHAAEGMGLSINFSFARSLGSIGYAIFTSIMGRALNHFSPRLLPGLYLITLLMTAVLLFLFRTPPCTREKKDKSSGASLMHNAAFMLFLSGLLCICLNHTLIDSFMLQIMQSIGGGSSELGVAIAIAAIVEVPVMMLYPFIRKKLSIRTTLILCGWAWFIKNLLTALAVSPVMVYAAQMLQSLGYAIYVPLAIDLILKLLPEKDFLRGQALAGSAFTFGGVFATFAGGITMDALGVGNALKVMVLFSLAGAVLFTIAAMSAKLKKQ